MRPPPRLRQMPALLAVAVVLAPWLGATAEPASGQINYTNPRYGFTLSLPASIFTTGSPKNPEVGGLWISRDGQARLLAVATANETAETLTEYRAFVMQQTYQGATFDYTPMRENWFVLSGRKDGQMFYERITFACEGRYIYGWQIFYPVAERRRWDRIVEAIHRSYRVGRGEDGRCGPT